MEQKIKDLLNNMCEKHNIYSYKELKTYLELDDSYSSVKLGKEIRSIACRNGILVDTEKRGSVTYLIAKKYIEVLSIKKDKTLVSFLDNKNNVVFSFDYNQKKEESFNERYYYSFIGEEGSKIAHLLRSYSYLQEIPEFIWSYLDLVDTYSYESLNNITLVKGYTNFLRENNFLINQTTYEAFLLKDKKFPIKDIIKIIKDEANKNSLFSLRQYKEFNDWMDYQKFIKIAHITIKNGYEVTRNKFNILIKLCSTIGYQYLDTNRDIEYNIQNYENIKKEKEKGLLREKLSKLDFLNNKVIDDYIIVVPKDNSDLVDEGTQQHNCVGYFYNDNILRGKDLIYFLRKANSPTKSVVTCRYNIKERKTVEHRIVNNKMTNLKQERIIEIIDKAINENIIL